MEGANRIYNLHHKIKPKEEKWKCENPIFLYQDKFYEVSSLWVTPGLSEGKQWQIPIGAALGACWTFTGVLFLKWRNKE